MTYLEQISSVILISPSFSTSSNSYLTFCKQLASCLWEDDGTLQIQLQNFVVSSGSGDIFSFLHVPFQLKSICFENSVLPELFLFCFIIFYLRTPLFIFTFIWLITFLYLIASRSCLRIISFLSFSHSTWFPLWTSSILLRCLL